MTQLLERPIAAPRTEPRRRLDRPAILPAPTQPQRSRLRDQREAAGELAFGWILGVALLVVQLVIYATVVLMFPLLPFLLPLALFPAALLYASLILLFGVGVTALAGPHA
jgi:hypothetical protein